MKSLAGKTNKIEPSQVRGARAMLDWSQTNLAEAAGIGVSTLLDFEAGRRATFANNLAAIRKALEHAGVVFINAGKSGGPGIRLR